MATDAEAEFLLAQLLWETGGDRNRALGLARGALAFFKARVDLGERQSTAIAKWLASR